MSLGLCGYFITQEHSDEIVITKLQAVDEVYADHLHALDSRIDYIDINGTRQLPDVQRRLDEMTGKQQHILDRLDSDDQAINQCRQALHLSR